MREILKRMKSVITYFFVVVLSFASVTKLIYLENFQEKLGELFINASYGSYAAYMIIGLQIILFILISFKNTQFYGFLGISLMFLFFSIYIGHVLSLGGALPCTCLGILDGLSWKQNFQMALMLFFIALIGFLISNLHQTRTKENGGNNL